MFILIVYSFIAGLVTILSPCILPLLPIILSSGVTGSKRRPLGVIIGFIISFTLATLVLASIVKLTGISADSLRFFAIAILFLFGLVLLIPSLQKVWEQIISRFVSSSPTTTRSGFSGGILIGLSLGIVWTPCVGPILATIITLAATSTITSSTVLITASYAVGTAIPLFLIMQGSTRLLTHFTWFKTHSRLIQQFFGAFMILTALMLQFQLDRRFQTYILTTFPNYGTGLTQIEDTETVRESLNTLFIAGGNMKSNLKKLGKAPELSGGQSWLNSDPLTLAGLEGKVVLIDFWTYSCINCIRTLPYLRAWHEKYAEKGLVIIGVHSPEFEFEKSLSNLTRAAADFELKYPIVQDNEFTIWRAYNNHYWPAKYLIDKDGAIRYTHFGEGSYAETEQTIQELLGESVDLVNMPTYKHESRSPETYLGYWRLTNVISSPKIVKNKLETYQTPDKFTTNGIGLEGSWTVFEKHATPKPSSSLYFRFDAKEVNLVMSPVDENSSPTIKIYLDGEFQKDLKVEKDQLYNLIKLDQGENHTIQIEFPAGGVEVYAFTFG